MATGAVQGEAGAERPSAFAQAVAIAESMDPTAAPGPPDSGDLVERFPELARIEARDVTIEGTTRRRRRAASTGDPPPAARRSSGCTAGRSSAGTSTSRRRTGCRSPSPPPGSPSCHSTTASRCRGVHYPVPSDDVLDGWLWATAHTDEVRRRARRPAPRRRERRGQPRRRCHQAAARRRRAAAVIARARVPDRPRRSCRPCHPTCRRSWPPTGRGRASHRRWCAR